MTNHQYTKSYRYFQGVFDTLNAMILQLLTDPTLTPSRRAHIRGDMGVIATDAIRRAEALGYASTARAIRTYRVWYEGIPEAVKAGV